MLFKYFPLVFVLINTITADPSPSPDTVLDKTFDVIAHPAPGKSSTIGHLHISPSTATFTNTNPTPPDDFCVSIKGLPHHECIIYTNTLSDKSFKVYIDQSGNIDQITLIPSTNGQPPPKAATNTYKTPVVSSPGPAPNLHPNNIPKKQLKQPVEPITDADGNTVENEEEKSWVQQNWLYIVPPLLIMFVLLGDDTKK